MNLSCRHNFSFRFKIKKHLEDRVLEVHRRTHMWLSAATESETCFCSTVLSLFDSFDVSFLSLCWFSPLFSLTPLFIHFLKNTLPVLQWGAHDGSSGEEVCQVWHRPGQVGGLQPDVVPVRQLHVLPLQRAHHWLQPLLPARTLTWCSLPPLPQMLPLDRPHGNLSVILTSHFFFLLAWLWTDVTLPLRPVYILSQDMSVVPYNLSSHLYLDHLTPW